MARRLCPYFLFAIVLMMFSSSLLLAQTSSHVVKRDEVAPPPSWKAGTEIDLLPYVMNGYYASAFVARDAWRLRGVVARSQAPSFW